MKNFIKVLLVGLITPFIMSNSCSKSQKNQNISDIIIDKSFDYSSNIAQYQIKQANLKDSLLTLIIEAKICKNDFIELVFNGNYLKSMPPKAQLGLRFQENNKCKKQSIEKTFNVAKIKYPGNKTTILLLPGVEPITF